MRKRVPTTRGLPASEPRDLNAPADWHTVTPRIAVHDPEELMLFLHDVFGASGAFRSDRPAVLTIGDSRIMIGNADARGVFPAFLYVYVHDVDTTFERAEASGVEVIEPPLQTPYGDRRATVKDRWGNIWQIASPAPRS